MNIPFISNLIPRVIMAIIYSMSASLIEGGASPPTPLFGLCAKLNSETLTDRPTYLFFQPLFFYLFHYNSPNHERLRENLFLCFCPTHPHRGSYINLHQIFQVYSLLPNPSLLLPKYLMPSYLISTLKKYPKPFPFLLT